MVDEPPEPIRIFPNNRVSAVGSQSISVSGDVNIAYVGSNHQTRSRPDRDALADRRESFLFRFYEQALSQHSKTFRLSMVFMSLGTVLLLLGASIALFQGAGRPQSAAVLSSLTGVVITGCGGAFAVQAAKARRHVTDQADKLHEALIADRTLAQAVDLIDSLEQGDERQRLLAIAALRALGVDPATADNAAQMLPSQQEPPRMLPPG